MDMVASQQVGGRRDRDMGVGRRDRDMGVEVGGLFFFFFFFFCFLGGCFGLGWGVVWWFFGGFFFLGLVFFFFFFFFWDKGWEYGCERMEGVFFVAMGDFFGIYGWDGGIWK